jgi:hypothetical protein
MFSNQLSKTWKYKWYGFWGAELKYEGREYNLDEYIDNTCPVETLEKVLFYLDRAPIVPGEKRSSQKCGLCDSILNYSLLKSDGVWLWNDSLIHYVKDHSFCIPNALVSRILSANGIPPKEIDVPFDRLPWP